MAGTYAHIGLVYSICRDTNALDSIQSLTESMKRSLMLNLKFCELGAVSPDYPYLTLLDSDAEGWANVMHYWKSADFIRHATDLIRALDPEHPDTPRCVAWLFGFTAHVVTDLTIHPVIQMKVGPYAQNKTHHRRCELNQDVYIFRKLEIGNINKANYIRDAGVAACSDESDHTRLNFGIAGIWNKVLQGVSLDEARKKLNVTLPVGLPDPDNWHREFVDLVDYFVQKGGIFPPRARHILEEEALVYPRKVDLDYIENLQSPDGTKIHYDKVFAQAQENVKAAWGQLGAALSISGNATLLTLKNGDLDTGKDENSNPIYWS